MKGLAALLERQALGLLDDIELADFIDLNVINDEERAAFKKLGFSVIGSFTGKPDCTRATERVLNRAFKRWNQVLGCKIFFPY